MTPPVEIPPAAFVHQRRFIVRSATVFWRGSVLSTRETLL
jgi:hypothetical protein